MGKLVTPKVFMVGFTEMNDQGVLDYLKESGNEDFWASVLEARVSGISNAEILCSMFAKLCYKSLTIGKNQNITRVRDISDNIKGCFDTGHGSIFEHVGFNFVFSDCSRVFTHELVRHRIGTAFSQNSGRYIRLDNIDIVFDPILEPVREDVLDIISYIETMYAKMCDKMNLNNMKNFDVKKKITSALRRVAPNGQSNEIGFTVNLRTLRHTVMMRTARFAEWEIRKIFQDVYLKLKDKYPLIFHGAKEEVVEGIIEVSGMKLQPYEKYDQEALASATTEALKAELARRKDDAIDG